MNAQLIRYIQGYVKVTVAGTSFERLINRLAEGGVPVWDIRRRGESRGECFITVPDYFRLKPFLRETGCRMRTTERYGLPFLLDKLGRRKWFLTGAAGFVVGMYLLSSVVWSVEVTGNETIPREQILNAASAEGLHPLQWKFRLGDRGELADRLTRSLPNAAWIGIDMQGTAATIRVVEATIPAKRTPQSPRHIVSNSDGVITSIIADRGVPQVGVHSRVRRGDILISGILGDEENREAVVAEGKVRGLVWYEYNVTVPTVKQHQALTGNARSSFHLVLGSRALQLTGYWQKPFANERVDTGRKQLRIGPWTTPVGWMTVTRHEAAVHEEKRTAKEARETGLANARADLIANVGGDAVVRQEKILHERTDNGKVVMKVVFEVEVDLAAERTIMPEELAPPEPAE